MSSIYILNFNETFWQSMLSPKTSWSTLFLEWADTFLILCGLFLILGELAFLNVKKKSLTQQKQKSIELCLLASNVTLFAGLLPFLRIGLLPESPFFHEIFKTGVLLTAAFILSNSEQFIIKHPERPILEYSFFVLTGVSFLLLLIESDDFITLFLNLLGFSLSLYVLIMIFWSEIRGSYSRSLFPTQANYRFEPFEQAHEASLKYFYLSAFSSALILLSITIFYSLTQTVSFDELQLILNMDKLGGTRFNWVSVWEEIFWLALALYIIGFAFKLSAWPSHYWAPEVYQGAASPVTAFILMPVKIAVFAIFARTLVTVFDSLHYLWGSLLLFFGLGSLVVGAFGALTERVFKKFIAYSSINQIGYLLIGLSTGQIVGLQTVMFFFIIYIVTTLVLFAVFLNLENNVTGEHLRYISELSFISPHEWLPRAALTVVFFSLAGLPPFAGFFSKFYLLLHLFEKGSRFAVFIGIVTSLISAYYYLTLVNYMWFGSVPKGSRKKNNFVFPIYRTQWKKNTVFTLYVCLTFLTLYIFINAPFLNFSYSLAQSCAYFSKGITFME